MAPLSNARPANPPVELNVKFCKENGDPLPEATMYQLLVGNLILTRPDIAYVVQVASPFVNNPYKTHRTAMHHILHYIRGIISRGLFYSTNSSLVLKGYAEANWVGCPDTRRSTTGWVKKKNYWMVYVLRNIS